MTTSEQRPSLNKDYLEKLIAKYLLNMVKCVNHLFIKTISFWGLKMFRMCAAGFDSEHS